MKDVIFTVSFILSFLLLGVIWLCEKKKIKFINLKYQRIIGITAIILWAVWSISDLVDFLKDVFA
jgi:Mn2+/Fe2+ NRAMP family transporter